MKKLIVMAILVQIILFFYISYAERERTVMTWYKAEEGEWQSIAIERNIKGLTVWIDNNKIIECTEDHQLW